jgi:hypothetical protein
MRPQKPPAQGPDRDTTIACIREVDEMTERQGDERLNDLLCRCWPRRVSQDQ